MEFVKRTLHYYKYTLHMFLSIKGNVPSNSTLYNSYVNILITAR